MTLATELDASTNYQVNYVIAIGTTPTYFSKYQVDSGLTVDADKVGLLSKVTTNPSTIDLTRIKSTVNSTSIEIDDDPIDQVFAIFLGASDNVLVNEQVSVYIGVITGSFDWADYVKVNDYVIQGITSSKSRFSIAASSRVNSMITPTFDLKSNLNGAITSGGGTIIVNSTSDDWEATGILKLEEEFVAYTTKVYDSPSSTTTFTGLTRGHLDSTPAAHVDATEVQSVFEATGNPVTIILSIMLSQSGTSIYDTYPDGVGIDESLINVTDIEAIRSAFFSGDTFTLYLYDVQNTLEYVEKELLKPNNLRYIETDDGISLAILDQTTPGAPLNELNEDNTETNPNWKVNANRVINTVTVKYDWSEGLQNFQKIKTYTDADSITSFGSRVTEDLEFKGIATEGIVNDRMNRFLARFSTPQVEINCNSFLSTYSNKVGDKVLFTSSELPQEGGGLGIDTELEIVSKAIDFNTGQVKYKLVYTSYFGIRRGLIAPSPLIVSVTDQKTFTVPDASCYRVGYFLRLWNDATKTYYADVANEIDTIDTATNTITMKNNFTTTLTTSVRVKFPIYDQTSSLQKSRYASIVQNSGIFAFDSVSGYQIDF